MYLRFALPTKCARLPSDEGVFTVCYALLEEGQLAHFEQEQVRRHLDWFEEYLPTPECLDNDEYPRALCWFKSNARNHLAAMWELVAVLDVCDVPVDFLKTNRPGIIVYQDLLQIAAVPHRPHRAGRRW